MPSASSESRQQIRGSFLLLAGRVVSLLLNLLTQVLAVRYLVQADYGAFAFALASIELISYVSMLGLNKTCSRFLPIYHERGDYDRTLGTLVMSVATVLGLSAAIMLGVIAGREFLAEYVVSSRLSLTLLLTLIALAPIEALDFIFESFFGAFSEVRVVFFRRYILRPSLKLAAVVGVMLLQAGVQTLAYCYLAAGILGFFYYVPSLLRVLRQQQLWSSCGAQQLRFPVREVWRFNGPLLSSHLVFLCQGSVAILLLEALSGNVAVGEFRAVLPFARLNVVVLTCFSLLFTPLACRLSSRNDDKRIEDLYWDSVTWIAVLTFPIFATTVIFSRVLTSSLLGSEYASASVPLTLLALGFFFQAILGLSGHLLRVYARIRYILFADAVATLASALLLLVLIPRYGAVGAAIGTCAFTIVAHLAHTLFAHFVTNVKTAAPRGLKVYASILLTTTILLALERTFDPSWGGAAVIVALAWLGLLLANRRRLAVERVSPELMRFAWLRRLISLEKGAPTGDATEAA